MYEFRPPDEWTGYLEHPEIKPLIERFRAAETRLYGLTHGRNGQRFTESTMSREDKSNIETAKADVAENKAKVSAAIAVLEREQVSNTEKKAEQLKSQKWERDKHSSDVSLKEWGNRIAKWAMIIALLHLGANCFYYFDKKASDKANRETLEAFVRSELSGHFQKEVDERIATEFLKLRSDLFKRIDADGIEVKNLQNKISEFEMKLKTKK